MYICSTIKENKTRLFKLSVSGDPNLYTTTEMKSSGHCVSDDFACIHCHNLYAEGVCAVDIKMDIKQQITDVFEVSDEYIQISFFFEGRSFARNDDAAQINTDLSPGFVQQAYGPGFKANFDMPGGQQVRYVSIFMTKPYFLNLLKYEQWKKDDHLYQHVQRGSYVNFAQHTQMISTAMRIALAALFEQRFDGLLNKDYFQTKLREIFLLYYLEEKATASCPENVTKETYAKLQQAKAYLSSNLSNYPTIKQLSRIVMLNEMNLKQGFKVLYGQTIYNYVFEERMKEAQRLLLQESRNVGKVAAQVGYHSLSHFISVYKKHYGFTPKNTLVNRS